MSRVMGAAAGAQCVLEIHAENYLVAGGPMHADLAQIAERYPLSIHGVGLSLGTRESFPSTAQY